MYDQVVSAVRSGDVEELSRLLELAPGSVLSADGSKPSATWVAAATNRPECLKVLARVAPASLRSAAQGLTPATMAANIGHGAILEAIAEVDVTLLAETDITGQTAVHHAAANGRADVLAILGRVVPDQLDRVSATGMTAMDLAWNIGHDDCVKVLSDHGILTVADKWNCGCAPGEACGPESTELD